MNTPVVLKPHLCRFVKIYSLDSKEIPSELFEAEKANEKPDLSCFPLPLPSKKSDYICSAVGGDGAVWYGASNGVTRYNEKADDAEDAVMHFGGDRYLADNAVKTIIPAENGVWVLTQTGASLLQMKSITCEEKADMLLDETLKYVDRRGMVSDKFLAVEGDVTSAVKEGHSDNDGGFTACFAVGEIYRYAVLKREKGENAPETLKAKATATRATEAALLLSYIHGRGNGFVARTYLVPGETLPDDGLFFRKENGRAVCLDTSEARRRNLVGYKCDASFRVPDRLAKLYKDLGYTDEGIVYKGDTSSDEITLQMTMMWLANRILCPDDPELGELIKNAVTATTAHIVDNGYRLIDATGEATTWAKWDEEYFNSDMGWVDACNNASEMLMYLRIAMEMDAENPKWRETYDYLIGRGYADLVPLHYDRLWQATLSMGSDFVEDIMFGDHMLAVTSLLVLCQLEDDEALLSKYRAGMESWRTSIAKEHNPGYDFPYLVSCPGAEIDLKRMEKWFYRFNVSRIASGVATVGRHDVPVVTKKAGYKQNGFVLTPDETFIAKFDRDPLEYKNEDSGGKTRVESCYVYTWSYWMGRYYGFIK